MKAIIAVLRQYIYSCSAVSIRSPTTPTPSTCLSSIRTISLSSSSLCFSLIQHLPLLIKAFGSAQTPDRGIHSAYPAHGGDLPRACRYCLRATRHAEETARARDVRVVMLTVTHGGARQRQQKRCGYSLYAKRAPAVTQLARRPGGSRGTQRNEACLSEMARRATRG